MVLIIWAPFAINFVAKNCQKSPNLVPLWPWPYLILGTLVTMSLTAQVRVKGAKNFAANGSRKRKLHWRSVKHLPESWVVLLSRKIVFTPKIGCLWSPRGWTISKWQDNWFWWSLFQYLSTYLQQVAKLDCLLNQSSKNRSFAQSGWAKRWASSKNGLG